MPNGGWNWLAGYVIIKIEGDHPERFLNLALQNEIEVWDTEWQTETQTESQNDDTVDVLVIKAARRDLRELKKIAKICGCRLQAGRGLGLPFVWLGLLGRKGFLAGLLLFVLGLAAALQVVWAVRVLPQEPLHELDVALVQNVADELGLRRGAVWRRLDTDELADELADAIPELSWVYVERRGTVANIKVAERSIYPDELDNATLGPIIANRDGLIQAVLIKHGQAVAAHGDTVKQGDVLVQPLADGRADAIIQARVWYTGYGEASLTEELVTPLAKTRAWYLLGADGRRLLLWGQVTEALAGQRVAVAADERRFAVADVEVGLLREERLLQQVELRQRSEAEAKAAAYQAALGVVFAQQNADSRLLAEQVEYALRGDVWCCVVDWECLEDIGEHRD